MALIIIIQVIITYVGDEILRSKPLLLTEWLIIIAVAFTIIPVDMVKKWVFGFYGNKGYI